MGDEVAPGDVLNAIMALAGCPIRTPTQALKLTMKVSMMETILADPDRLEQQLAHLTAGRQAHAA